MQWIQLFAIGWLVLLLGCQSPATQNGLHSAIDRRAVVTRHNPSLAQLDPQSPFTLGNGRFAFTADVTGVQTFADAYFAQGIPLETKARWAWHSRPNTQAYRLSDASEVYSAYGGRAVAFPTQMDSPAGQWLRQNPHDLPLGQVSLTLHDEPIASHAISHIDQQLDLWRGELVSRFRLSGTEVTTRTLVDSESDSLAVRWESPALGDLGLGVRLRFPRGYNPAIKNTPDTLWGEPDAHTTEVLTASEDYALLRRRIDDAEHFVALQWQGDAALSRITDHDFRLHPNPGADELTLVVRYFQREPRRTALASFAAIQARTAASWANYWSAGAAVDFSDSRHPSAIELERRLVLSQYLLAAQARAEIPAQETGLTASSWYGKHHTEMTFWHAAHWVLWGRTEPARRVLDWYREHLPSARELAAERGLAGARWAKMVSPDQRESPGGNPLIIWNQPQPIHLAELLYQRNGSTQVLEDYGEMVQASAEALAAMVVWNDRAKVYELTPPIWIAQEIYDPRQTTNPTFELAYWRAGLEMAQTWRKRRGLPQDPRWQHIVDNLAPLPSKDGKYVAVASQPDTFDNAASRVDHPTMVAPLGMLADPTVNLATMAKTFDAVMDHWDWETKIWGWDYPLLAMTAARLDRPQQAVDLLLADLPNNRYLNNGHVPQAGPNLPVYLPANGALLTATALMLGGWPGAPQRTYPGFPVGEDWQIRAEGFMPYPL